jgi:hypothetical protein
MEATRGQRQRRRAYLEASYSMGTPRINVDKALALVAALDEDESVRRLMLQK